MSLNVGKELKSLGSMTVAELRDKYVEVFGEETRSRHRIHLIRRIIWRMQANEYGGLSERARRRAEEIADDSDLRMIAPKKMDRVGKGITHVGRLPGVRDSRLPMPGCVITREYGGVVHRVMVRHEGFEYGGERYGSLSAVAKEITGSHWNGYDFFQMGKKRVAKRKKGGNG